MAKKNKPNPEQLSLGLDLGGGKPSTKQLSDIQELLREVALDAEGPGTAPSLGGYLGEVVSGKASDMDEISRTAALEQELLRRKNAEALVQLQAEQAAALRPKLETPEELNALEKELGRRRRERMKGKAKSSEAIREIKRENQRRLKAGQKKLTAKEKREIRTRLVVKKRGSRALNKYLGKGSWLNPLTVKGGLTAMALPLAAGFATDVSRGMREQFGAGSTWFDGKDAVDEMLEPQMAQAEYTRQLRRRTADLERMRSINRDKIEKYAPHLAASLKAGMELPEDAVVIGGRPRMDLLNDVADRMYKGEFNQE